jgi:DNA-binding CsgD family transcriptional regulator
MAGLTCLGVAIRDLARQYVYQYYNFDIDQKRFVPGDGGPPLTLDGDILLSKADISSLVAACLDAALCETMLLAGLQALGGSQHLEGKAGSECMQAAVDAMLGVLEALPLFTGTLMESPLEHQQEQGALAIAGWAATQLSLYKNRRLRHALEQDGSPSEQAPYTAFLAQLPGAVHLAYSTDPDASLDTLLTNIKHVLEPGASRSRAKGAQDALPAVQPSVEEMWLREETRQAMEIENPYVRTRLTQRELEFCDLMYELARQGKSCTYAEIAAQKGVAEGTVKSTMDHIRGKLRHIASA